MASIPTKKAPAKKAPAKTTAAKTMPRSGSASKKRPAGAAKRTQESSASRAAASGKEAPAKGDPAGAPPDDVNEVALEGRLATAPDIRTFDSGVRLARLLVTVRSEVDRPRTDVIPVTVWNPAAELGRAVRGDRVVVSGTVQRRFWTDIDGRKSRVEVVASSVEVTRAEPDT